MPAQARAPSPLALRHPLMSTGAISAGRRHVDADRRCGCCSDVSKIPAEDVVASETTGWSAAGGPRALQGGAAAGRARAFRGRPRWSVSTGAVGFFLCAGLAPPGPPKTLRCCSSAARTASALLSVCLLRCCARAGSDRRGCFAGPSGAGRCGSRAPRAPRQRCVVASCAGPAACASRPLSAIVSKMTNSAIFPITFLVQKTPVELCWLQCASAAAP